MSMYYMLALLCAASAAPTSLESVRVSFSQKALDFAEDIAQLLINVVQDKALAQFTIPNISTNKFRLKNMQLKTLSLDKPELTIIPGVGLKWVNDDAGLTIKGDWSVKAGWWWTSGSLTLDTSMRIEAEAKITAKNGKLSTSPVDCDVDFNRFNLNLHNSFYTWIGGMMKSSITPEITKAVCNEINGLLRTTANEAIASLPHEIPVAGLFDVKIEADTSPVFSSGHLDIHARVKADSQSSTTTFPFSPEPMNSKMDDSYMACILVSDYTLNTGSYIALPAGVMEVKIPNEFVDASNEILNTKYFTNILPELYTAYPDMPMSFTLVNTRYPKIEFNANEVIIDMPVDLSVKVSGQMVMSLTVKLTTKCSLKNVNNVVSGEVVESDYATTVVSSLLPGQTTEKDIEAVVGVVMSQTVLPELNALLKAGIALPIAEYVVLKEGLLEAHDDFLKVCADIDLTAYGQEQIKKMAEDVFN